MILLFVFKATESTSDSFIHYRGVCTIRYFFDTLPNRKLTEWYAFDDYKAHVLEIPGPLFKKIITNAVITAVFLRASPPVFFYLPLRVKKIIYFFTFVKFQKGDKGKK